MSDKIEILAHAIENFTRFGSKRFSMDELASELGISKKTLYKHFSSKEKLVSESLAYFLNDIRTDIEKYISENPNKEEPLTTIIYIYKKGLMVYQNLNPSFLRGLNKYYPEAYQKYIELKKEIVWNMVHPLLQKAQILEQIRPNVNLELVCTLFLSRMEDIVYSKENLFNEFSIKELLDHIIINNLRGILTLNYLQKCPV
ncbi:TetR/AcrR family transcriptional regulator [Allomuricauda sp. XS_ASV26]|uniref:TetR family transcriptional regulator n=1 Tax=Flagellimonas marinaquae TaxID=254955 RepID=A0AA48HD85_9FLAO|nr:TetR/AcrR family transcriptional regulator [Allomuricauda ruestringensis]MCA0958801.1 TetR/AcrR family transcriptional regulator [Allomuricauda ruestringensis]BDW92232.1 TetR family transcriptional regulator [Allomuricauda aquimarina]